MQAGSAVLVLRGLLQVLCLSAAGQAGVLRGMAHAARTPSLLVRRRHACGSRLRACSLQSAREEARVEPVVRAL
jgi:hypothetical protein